MPKSSGESGAGKELLDFIQEFFAISDGVVERPSPDRLEVLLPQELSELLNVGEELVLTSTEGNGSGDGGEVHITYSHPLLEHIIDILSEGGKIAAVELTDIAVRTSGLKSEVRNVIELKQCSGEVEGVRESWGNYLLLNFKVRAFAGERAEFQTRFELAWNEETSAVLPWLDSGILERVFGEIQPPTWRTPFQELYPKIASDVEGHLPSVLKDFTEELRGELLKMRRQLEREFRREKRELIQPLRQLLKDYQSGSVERERLERAYREAVERSKALDGEFLERVEELPSRLEWGAVVEPFAAVRVVMPVAKIRYRLKFRSETRSVELIWNPLIEEFEPLLCEGCGKESRVFTAGQDLKLLCNRCRGDR